METPFISLFKKIPLRWMKILSTVTLILFILGGVFNDGWTKWFLSLPFIWLLSKKISTELKIHILTFVCLTFVVVISSASLQGSKIMYPVIGDQILLKEEIPVIYTDQSNHYIYYQSEYEKPAKFVPKGTTLKVEEIKKSYADFGNSSTFVLSNNKDDTFIHISDLDMSLKNIITGKMDTSFCIKVDWDFCSRMWFDISDPMFKPFRLLANLMYYPIAPFLLFGLIISLPHYFAELF